MTCKLGLAMKNTTLLVITLALAACAKDPTSGKNKASVGEASAESSAPLAGAEKLAITPANSTIGFVGAKVTAQHEGSFSRFSGAIDLVDGKAEKSRVSVEIDMASVEIEPEKLKNHLKSQDFFHVELYKTATFVSTKIEPGSDKQGYNYTVTGNLELRGVKRGVSFPANIQIAPDRVKVATEFGINRKDFGIEYPGMQDDLIKDNVLIKLALDVPRAPRS